QFVFDERTTCLLGRAEDCQARLPSDDHHKTISRHHCLLDINPPDIRIRDFGSLNGTAINGTKIGQRQMGQTPEEAALTPLPEHDLKEGDEIQLGNTVFRVSLFVPAVCSRCATEIPEEQKARAQQAAGVYCCLPCQEKEKLAPVKQPAVKAGKVCSKCGRDVSAEGGGNPPRDYVCTASQA